VALILNERAQRLADHMAANAATLRILVQQSSAGARLIDCGIMTEGGLNAGLALARICLAGLAEVTLVPGDVAGTPCPLVQVATDHPVAACMASQYAGWEVKVDAEKFFGMGSGPMRAIYAREPLFEHIEGREQAPVAVGVLETRKLPGDGVIDYLCERLELPANKLTLLVAPPSSVAGNLQVVARSVEMALHKLHELKFDLTQVVAGFGTAPLPPIAADELAAFGRMNDAILYGGRVILWVRSDDAELAELGPRVPASASPDYGTPFADIFERYQGDFYKIDPLLFSPAQIHLCNLRSGKNHTFGQIEPDVLQRSFFTEG
jgi:methenyltetrahydromethanopterin cyclohydrolase